MLRRSLLFLSERDRLKQALLKMRSARRVASRFVGGETIEDAIGVTGDLNEQGFRVTLDYLGESVSDTLEADRAAVTYETSLARIAASGVSATISLKPTQLGLDIDLETCVRNVKRVVEAAAAAGSFVRLDMEGSQHTQPTLDLLGRVFETHRNIGVVIQAYLHRSESDIDALVQLGAPVRLCKGAYSEPASIAYPRKEDIDANFVHLMRRLLAAGRGRPSVGGVPPVAIATHDDRMIEATRSHVESHAFDVGAFEFQMLYGVRRDYQVRLLEEGYHVRIYVPYGTEWYPYFMRRMAERPANLWFVTRTILGR